MSRFDGKDFKLEIRVENALETNKWWNAVKNLYDFDLDVEGNTEKDEKSKLIVMSLITDKILKKNS